MKTAEFIFTPIPGRGPARLCWRIHLEIQRARVIAALALEEWRCLEAARKAADGTER